MPGAPQPGQPGSESFSKSERCEPQSTQKNVPEPGIVPVSKLSDTASGRMLVKISNSPSAPLVRIVA